MTGIVPAKTASEIIIYPKKMKAARICRNVAANLDSQNEIFEGLPGLVLLLIQSNRAS